jgi:SAM-dependent methyltransferase
MSLPHLASFLRNPLGFVKRAVYKLTIGRLKYASRDDYNAELYWGDRFRKYGLSLMGPGHDGFSLKENEEAYREAAAIFVSLCNKENVDFRKSRVLEIGCGTGYYAELFKAQGVGDYLGVDVTDALFADLRKKFQDYQFAKIDVATQPLPCDQPFNLVTLIDVAQHIVNRSKLQFALENIDRSLASKGRFIFTAELESKSSIHAFYEMPWIMKDFVDCLPNHIFSEPGRFRDKYIISSTKK